MNTEDLIRALRDRPISRDSNVTLEHEAADALWRLESERHQERVARKEAQRQLYAERERLYKLVSDEQAKACRLRAEIEALRRGEFICSRCGLRKDADVDGAAPF